MSSSSGTLLEHPLLAGVRAAAAGLGRAARAEAWQPCDADIEDSLAALVAVEARTAALRAVLLAEAETRSLKDRTQALSTAQWLTQRFRYSRAEAAARLREAALLGELPVVRAALAEGSLTVEQARVVAAALGRVDALPAVTEADRAAAAGFLIEAAASLSPAELARAGQALAEALTASPDTEDPAEAEAVAREHAAAEAAAQAAEQNRLVTRRRPGGGFSARFEVGNADEPVFAAWLRAADTPHAGTDGFEDTRARDQRRGDHLLDTLRADLTATGGNPTQVDDADHPDTADPDTADDADDAVGAQLVLPGPLADLRALTGTPGRLTPSHIHIGVTVPLDALQQGLAGAGRLDTGATLSAAELRRLACDAGIIPIVLDGQSMPLDVGRTLRDFTLNRHRLSCRLLVILGGWRHAEEDQSAVEGARDPAGA
jgi:Domain of unknown function (DUF222)